MHVEKRRNSATRGFGCAPQSRKAVESVLVIGWLNGLTVAAFFQRREDVTGIPCNQWSRSLQILF